MPIKIFTDGSSLGNPGPGGFCAIIKVGGKVGQEEHVIKGGEKYTTNNRMEMMAIIAGLQTVAKKFPGEPCEIYSDSNLIIQTITKGWKRKKNLDLWANMDSVITKLDGNIKWNWIRGHSGHPENTKADRIAVLEAKKAGRLR